MKKFITLFVVGVIFLSCPLISQAESFSATYKIQVVIPAIVGLNVKDPDSSTVKAGEKSQNVSEFLVERITEDGQKIIYRTTVVK